MHHVGVALDYKALGNLHGTGFGYPAYVVAAQIDEHEMFSSLFGIGQQLFFELKIFRFIVATAAGASKRPAGDLAIFYARKNLGTRTDNLEIVEVMKYM